MIMHVSRDHVNMVYQADQTELRQMKQVCADVCIVL